MVWPVTCAWVQGGPVVWDVGPVVLVVDPLAWAGMELAHPGNATVRVNDPTVHVQSEKVMLEAAVDAEPGVRTAVRTCAGPVA